MACGLQADCQRTYVTATERTRASPAREVRRDPAMLHRFDCRSGIAYSENRLQSGPGSSWPTILTRSLFRARSATAASSPSRKRLSISTPLPGLKEVLQTRAYLVKLGEPFRSSQ